MRGCWHASPRAGRSRLRRRCLRRSCRHGTRWCSWPGGGRVSGCWCRRPPAGWGSAPGRAGDRLLVRAAESGVGMAAVSIARYLGLEVYGTASPGKRGVLAGLGLDQAHIGSSRTADFEAKFLAATGAGVDIVLNSLAGELTDASLRLLRSGGAFIELNKTDVRDPATVARDHPGVAYQAFDLSEARPARLGP